MHPTSRRCAHLLSGWPKKKSPNFIFTSKMVFPKCLKFMNSGSECVECKVRYDLSTPHLEQFGPAQTPPPLRPGCSISRNKWFSAPPLRTGSSISRNNLVVFCSGASTCWLLPVGQLSRHHYRQASPSEARRRKVRSPRVEGTLFYRAPPDHHSTAFGLLYQV